MELQRNTHQLIGRAKEFSKNHWLCRVRVCDRVDSGLHGARQSVQLFHSVTHCHDRTTIRYCWRRIRTVASRSLGMVLLVGLVAKKHSILLIDLTNQLRLQGSGINEALLEACFIRMPPY